MSAERHLRDLAERWELAPSQVAALARALEFLALDPRAPSSVRDAAAVDVHIADSLSALGLECVAGASVVADLGSGAGFPGIVLAIALPDARVALVESATRKCEFLERLCRAAGADNARVVRARAEEWVDGLGVHDLVVARALAPLAAVCEYAAPLLAIGGSLVAWKGAISEAESVAAELAAALLGLRGEEVVRSEPYAGSVAHHLHVYRKAVPTPPGFPRRAGVARKRPLGGAQ